MKKLWWSRRKADFRIDWYSGSGAGGQHRNRHKNCLRLTDRETGIVTTGQEYKSRVQNQKSAFHKMVKKLLQYYKNLLNTSTLLRKQTPEFGKASRSYDLEHDRVTDHVTGKKYSYRHTVDRGDIGEIIKDRKIFLDNEQVKDL